MKLRILTLSAAALFLFSCGTKKSAPLMPLTHATPAVTETVKTTVLAPELAEGKTLFENSCARCHKLYDPKKFTQEDWKPILVIMQKKAHLDDTKMASISNYITSQL